MGITTGPAGNVWFTGWGANNIGELTPPPSRTPVRCGGPASGHGIAIIFADIGGKLTARNIQGSIFFLGFCGPPQFEHCTPTGASRQFHIRGPVTLQNVTGPEPGEPASTNVFTGYDVGGNVILKNVDGSGTLTDNTVGGDLLCKRVTQLSSWTVSGNTVGGADTCQPAG